MRTTGLTIALVVLAILLLVFSGPGQRLLVGVDVSAIIYSLLLVVLIGTSVVALRRRTPTTGGAPGIMMSILIWAAAFAFLVLLYRAAWFWGGFMTLIAALLPR